MTIQSTMTQLSPTSRYALETVRKALTGLDTLAKQGKLLFSNKVPHSLKNIGYILSLIKDVTTFIPSLLYKIVIGIIALSFIIKYFRKNRNKPQNKPKLPTEEQKVIEQIVEQSQKESNFQQLGPQYQVKESLNPTGQGQTIDDQDSCYQDLTQQLIQSNDFRDIVFFDLMRGYKKSAEQEAKRSKK